MYTVMLVFHLIKIKTVKVRILDYLVNYNFKTLHIVNKSNVLILESLLEILLLLLLLLLRTINAHNNNSNC